MVVAVAVAVAEATAVVAGAVMVAAVAATNRLRIELNPAKRGNSLGWRVVIGSPAPKREHPPKQDSTTFRLFFQDG